MKKFVVTWSNVQEFTPELVNGKTEMEFDTFAEAEKFFNEELEKTSYKSVAQIKKEDEEFFNDSNEVSESRCAHSLTNLELNSYESDFDEDFGPEYDYIKQSVNYWVED